MKPLIFLLSCLAVETLSLGARAEPNRVLVLKSADFSTYSSVQAGFLSELDGESFSAVVGQNEADWSHTHPILVFAIGPTAAVRARQTFAKSALIFSMVPHFEKYSLEGPNITGIALSPRNDSVLESFKAAAPELKRIGIVYDPRYSAGTVQDAQDAASQRALTLVPIEADSLGRAERALRNEAGRLDGMMMVADKTAAQVDMVKRIVEFCQEQRIPFFGLSASQVKEGAAYALSPNYLGIGQQAGRLAKRILKERILPSSLPIAHPEMMEFSVNLGVLHRLQAKCDAEAGVFTLAARKGYLIKVYE